MEYLGRPFNTDEDDIFIRGVNPYWLRGGDGLSFFYIKLGSAAALYKERTPGGCEKIIANTRARAKGKSIPEPTLLVDIIHGISPELQAEIDATIAEHSK